MKCNIFLTLLFSVFFFQHQPFLLTMKAKSLKTLLILQLKPDRLTPSSLRLRLPGW